MDKQLKPNKSSQVEEMTVTASLTELNQTENSEITATELVNNLSPNSPQNNLPEKANKSTSGNWLGRELKNGKYTIEKELGKGGFGITYLARNKEGKQVVIKMLKNELHNRNDFKQLEEDFVNEAVKLSQFKHPNIVPIIEVINDRGWCIVMEYIRGQTLDTLVKDQNNYLTCKDALHYIKQIAEALKAVHGKGLLHRDIKPQNILIKEDTKEAVLIDFGLALKFDRSFVANSGGLSHGYAALEQYESNVIWDYYTDIYALAATLYFALTKTKPISAKERAGAKKLVSPQSINPAISESVNNAIERGMTLDPTYRPQSVDEWLALLKPSKKKNSLSLAVLFTLFVLIGSSLATYFFFKSSVNGQLKFGRSLEEQCMENNLHPLTQKCQKEYFFKGKQGENIVIEMDSEEIDPLLVVLDDKGSEIAKNDDIDINNFNANIKMELQKDGIYRVIAQSSQPEELGSYSLKLTKD